MTIKEQRAAIECGINLRMKKTGETQEEITKALNCLTTAWPKGTSLTLIDKERAALQSAINLLVEICPRLGQALAKDALAAAESLVGVYELLVMQRASIETIGILIDDLTVLRLRMGR